MSGFISKTFFLLIFLIILNSVYSQDYYADIKIVVERTGIVRISGTANHEKLNLATIQEYTSKNSKY
ncbi:hypothetical protein GF327_07345 [Candidatus Woesearchaeota archaeon]|nr:hypothetical protein [Candidatus Woesearchaeota archaeon]